MTVEIRVPALGDNIGEVEVIDIAVAAGDVVALGATLVTLESDKAAMDIPAETAGKIAKLVVGVGSKVRAGDLLAVIEADQVSPEPVVAPVSAPTDPTLPAPGPKQVAPTQASAAPVESKPEPVPPPRPDQPVVQAATAPPRASDDAAPSAHASPAIRRFARELGVDLARVQGSGRKGRVTRQDVQGFVKRIVTAGASGDGVSVGRLPEIDFSLWGEIEQVPLGRIRKLTGENLGRSWALVPQVTQFDEADVTALEEFRKESAEAAAKRGTKLTLVALLLKTSARALKDFPDFNSSLHPSGEYLIRKKYIHIGVAVDTDAGLVVPVIRDADRKGLLDIAAELNDLSGRARQRKLKPDELQGSTFTISSLGGIGGTAFTPIVNWPNVAILGISRSSMKPVYAAGEFVPRLMLPLSLSYDHRVIDGATAVRFTRHLAGLLEDLRGILL